MFLQLNILKPEVSVLDRSLFSVVALFPGAAGRLKEQVCILLSI